MCSSLIIKTADNTVQLAHASVKEYFLHKPRQIVLSDVQLGHAAIAHCCLSYVLLPSESEGQDIFIFDYPAKFWSNHYQLSNKNEILQDLAKRFLWDQHGTFERWRRLGTYASLHLEHIYTGPSPLHYGNNNQNQLVNGKSQEMNGVGHTVHLLKLQQRKDILVLLGRLLLDKGANVNAQGGQYGNALQAASASWKGNAEIVRLLLDKGTDVDAQGGRHGNALHLQAASWRDCAEIIQILLDNGAQSGQSETEGKVWKKIWGKLHQSKVIQKFPHLKF